MEIPSSARRTRSARRLVGDPYRRWLLAPVARAYVEQLGAPVVAVTGTNGKTTVTRLLERVLVAAGYRVGMACSDGVLRDGRFVARGDSSGVGGVARAVRGGGVDVVVAETARRGIVRHGFGFRGCRVAVVTNVSDDHLGLDGVGTLDEMAAVKARLVERVTPDGAAVLDADDPRVAAMAPRARGAVIHFSRERLPPQLRRGVFLDGGWIHRREGGVETPLLAAAAVAVARQGLLAYNVANAMAVVAALDGIRPACPVADDVLRRVLATEGDVSAFAFRLVDFRGVPVLVSQSKNPSGFAADMPVLARVRRSLGFETVVGLLSIVGDRSLAFYRAVAGAAAGVCDRVAVVPPEDRFLRGRSPEEIVAGLEAGIPPEQRIRGPAGDCAAAIACLAADLPGKTLVAILNARQHRGIDDVLREGRPLDF